MKTGPVFARVYQVKGDLSGRSWFPSTIHDLLKSHTLVHGLMALQELEI
jgi:hypothetical protein